MYPFLQNRMVRPHIDVMFHDVEAGRYFRGPNQITQADWDETPASSEWWV